MTTERCLVLTPCLDGSEQARLGAGPLQGVVPLVGSWRWGWAVLASSHHKTLAARGGSAEGPCYWAKARHSHPGLAGGRTGRGAWAPRRAQRAGTVASALFTPTVSRTEARFSDGRDNTHSDRASPSNRPVSQAVTVTQLRMLSLPHTAILPPFDRSRSPQSSLLCTSVSI